MLRIIIAVLLSIFLGPGMGQLYNKQLKKGVFLVVASFGLLIAFSIWLGKAALPYLPSLAEPIDSQILKGIIQQHVISEHKGTFFMYELLLGGLWLYGVVDAYFGAVKKLNTPSVPPTEKESF